MHIRAFRESDAPVCRRIRIEAFEKLFLEELGPRGVAAGVAAFADEDYRRMAREGAFFVVEREGRTVGFITLQRHEPRVAEIGLIYIDLAHIGQGLGRACLRHAELWLGEAWPEVDTLWVDTIIPRTNGGFYRRMNFEEAGESVCRFPDLDLPATRFVKALGPADGRLE